MTKQQTPTIDLTSGLLLLALATVWGGSFFFAEIALREIPPLTIALQRVFWAVPALFLFVCWQGLRIPRSVRVWMCYLVMGTLNNAIPFSLIFCGQTSIGSGLASILNGTTAMTLSAGVWASLLALAILSTAVAYLLYFNILARAGSANFMLVTLLIPPIAVTLSVVFLGEKLGSEALMGFGIIAVGLAITDGRLLDRINQRSRR